MKNIASALFLLCLAFPLLSQSITWEKQYHFDQWTGPNFVVEAEDSGFFVTELVGNDTTELYLMKLNKYGEQEWRKIVNPYATSIESFIRKKPGVYLLIDSETKYDSITRKESSGYDLTEFNVNGNILWTKEYDSANLYVPYGLLSLGNSNYVMESELVSPGDFPNYYTPGKMLVQKFNGSNNIVWSDTFSYQKQTGAGAIMKTVQNDIMIGGQASKGGINSFVFTLLLDTNGKKLNYVPYPYLPDSFEQIDCIGQLKNGNIILQTSNKDYYSVFFTLNDSMGNMLNRWGTNGAYHNGTGGFVTDGDSTILLGSEGLLAGPLTLQKFDTGFHQIWEKQYDGTSYYYNYPQQILRTSDGGLLLVGSRSTSTYSDMVLIKVDDNGYCADQNLSNVENSKLLNIRISVFPNPATDNIWINTQNPYTNMNIDIFDSKGVKVLSLLLSNPGLQNIDIRDLTKGLYLYRIYNGAGIYNEGKFVKE